MKILLSFLLFVSVLFSDNKTDLSAQNSVDDESVKKEKRKIERQNTIQEYLEELKSIESQINKDKVWIKSYASYMASLDVRKSLKDIEARIKALSKKRKTLTE